MPNFLKVENGNVSMWNHMGQKLKTYYGGGDATRADWLDEKEGTIQVQTKGGKLKIVNKMGQVIRTI